MKLEGKVAIITGVSGDGQIGQTIAQAFAKEGAKLVLVARRAEKLNARADEVKALGAEVLPVPADLTNEEEVNNVVKQTLNKFGRVDILVNLAGGLTKYKAATEHTLEDWTSELNNNLLSAFLCSRAVFEPMKTGGGGRIINFARAGDPQAKMVAYNCAKAGVAALTRTLALEGRKHNIGVNAVGPGLVETKSNTKAMQPKPEDQARWPKREEIAASPVPGHDHHRELAVHPEQVIEKGYPLGVRHLQVHEHQVKVSSLGLGHGLAPLGSLLNFIPFGREDFYQDLALRAVVFRDKDCARFHSLAPRGRQNLNRAPPS